MNRPIPLIGKVPTPAADCPDPDMPMARRPARSKPPQAARTKPDGLPGIIEERGESATRWVVLNDSGEDIRRYDSRAEAEAFLDGFTYSPYTG